MGIETIIFTLISTVYQSMSYNKMKRAQEAEADKRRGSVFPIRGQAESVPVVYGRAALGGIEVKHKTMRDYVHSTGTFTKNLTAGATGTKNEFLLVQSVLAQKEIEEVLYVNVNNKDYQDKDFNHNFLVGAPDSANALGTANGIPTTATFSNCTNLTSVFRLKRDKPQYSGIPAVTSFVKGRKVRTISASNVLSTSYTYSNNPAYCLLDYLLDADYGLGITTGEVDLASFKHAANICDTVVSSGRLVGGRVHGVKPVKEYATVGNLPTIGDDAFLYKIGESTYKEWIWTDEENEVGSYSDTTAPTRNIPLYECNIVLDTSAKIRDNIQLILNTMGLAELTWTSEGHYKLLLEYPADQAALNALVHSDHEFDEDSIIREEVTLSWPSAEERLNQATIRFANEHEDFAEDSVTWPVTDSAAHSAYLTEDNNRPFVANVSLDGITDPYHAQARAEQLVRESRSTFNISLTVNKKGLSLEPGDFFKVTLPQQNLTNEIFRVTSIKVMSNFTVEVTGIYFDVNTLAWSVNDDIAYVSPPAFEFDLDPPENLSVTSGTFVSGDGSVFNSFQVDWDNADDSKVRDYEVQWKQSTDSTYFSAVTQNENFEIVNIVPNVTYDIRVRSRTATGILSDFVSTTDSNVGKDTAPNAPTGLAVEEAYQLLKLTYTAPADKDLAYIEVNEGSTNVFANSTQAGFGERGQFIRPNLANEQTLYFWARAVDFSGNTSSWVGPVNGTTTLIASGSFDENVQDILDTAGLDSVNSLPASGDFDNQIVFNLADNMLYRWTGTAWTNELYTGIEDGSIDSDAIAASAVTAAKIGNNAVTTAKIAVEAITSTELGVDAVTSAKIAAGAVTATEIGASAVTNAKIAVDAVDADQIAADAVTNAKIATGAVDAGQIAANAVTNAKIATGAVDSGKIGAGAVTTAKIANEAITEDLIGLDAITETKISDSAITTAKISAGAVTASTIATNAVTANKVNANAITAGKIAAGAVTTAKLDADAVTADKVAANAIEAGSIAAGAVTAAKIDTDAVTADKVAANAIEAGSIAAGAVTTAKLDADAVTADKVAANAIEAGSIASGAITTAKLAAGAITTGKLAAGAITTNKIAADAITTDKIDAGAVTAAEITAGAITTAKIAAGAVTATEIDTGAITAGKLAAGAVEADKIAANAITTDKIDAGAVTTNSIASNAIVSNKILAGAITAGKIDTDAVRSDKIQANAVTADKISVTDLSAISADLGTIEVDTANIADAAITNAKIGNLAVDTAQIAGFAVSVVESSVGGTADKSIAFTNNSGVQAEILVFCSYNISTTGSGSATVGIELLKNTTSLDSVDVTRPDLSPDSSSAGIKGTLVANTTVNNGVSRTFYSNKTGSGTTVKNDLILFIRFK